LRSHRSFRSFWSQPAHDHVDVAVVAVGLAPFAGEDEHAQRDQQVEREDVATRPPTALRAVASGSSTASTTATIRASLVGKWG
jgi:hypothetical protein